MDDCSITVRYGVGVSVLKHHPPGRVNACEKPESSSARLPQDTSARQVLEKALGGAVILLRCKLSVMNH